MVNIDRYGLSAENAIDPPRGGFLGGLFSGVQRRWQEFKDNVFGGGADQPTNSDIGAAINKTGAQAQSILDVQTAFIPGGSLLNPNSDGGDIALDMAGIFLPGLKFADKAKTITKFSDDIVKFAQGQSGNVKEVIAKIPEGFTKIKQTSKGQKVFSNGKTFISPDNTGHKGGIWKAADSVKNLGSKKTRLGTFNANLEKIDN